MAALFQFLELKHKEPPVSQQVDSQTTLGTKIHRIHTV